MTVLWPLLQGPFFEDAGGYPKRSRGSSAMASASNAIDLKASVSLLLCFELMFYCYF